MSSKLAPDGKPYWFAAKRYGWGWGLPLVWQGWVALAVFVVLIALDIILFPPHSHLVRFLLCTLTITLAFMAVCWLKGEPPKWRWGDNKE